MLHLQGRALGRLHRTLSCMDSLRYHGFSFGSVLLEKGSFHSEATHGLFCLTCNSTCSPIPSRGLRRPSWAPGSGLSHLTPADALLPGGLTRAAPVPMSLLIPSFLPRALGKAGGSSVSCCLSQPPSVPLAGVGASPRRRR